MKSMREFDYFADNRKPVDVDRLGELPEGLEGQVARHRALLLRYRLAIGAVVLGVLAGLFGLWRNRDDIAYAFRPATEPLVLGDVATFTPADIPHNAYVQLYGITEQRGITQKRLMHGELWYFRLLGSSGVFIEVPPDKEHYGVVTQLEVAGRAIDPAIDSSYASLLEDYKERWSPRERPSLRIIRVGAAPGQGRGVWLLALGVLSVAAAGAVELVRRLRHLRAAGPGR
jgi:hypothetical protein